MKDELLVPLYSVGLFIITVIALIFDNRGAALIAFIYFSFHFCLLDREGKLDLIRLLNLLLGLISLGHLAILSAVLLAFFFNLGNALSGINGGTGTLLPGFFHAPILWGTSITSMAYLWRFHVSILRHIQICFPVFFKKVLA
ncbi:MAG: hypothetical protein COX77_00080 [Candidatus Komeilibacteria bacterium CG_4_10_14_0_2_um_filter_37_10]|uniref:Uncharacterized protein n=1 Tax=Candidatus Komeilibacteria bacterium CG_4_10_14_0_2_um_filter_37_10 TaxID=1974470 RepID=A0A2M7VGP6_9BACT|nr:MAG: hypothetical protein COX77_00080 [Candidatus Komeilibacteria bacterium CG_4_10_14_0_2_um_filter_37_10]